MRSASSRVLLLLRCALVTASLWGRPSARAEPRREAGQPRARLERAVIDFAQSTTTASAARRLRQPAELARVAALQRTTPTDDALHYYAAFALAYLGRNYR